MNMSRDHRRILAKFRSCNIPLAVETGRYTKPKTPHVSANSVIVQPWKTNSTFSLIVISTVISDTNYFIMQLMHITTLLL